MQQTIDTLLRQHHHIEHRLFLLAENKASFLADIYRLLPHCETWPLMLNSELEAVAHQGPHLTLLPDNTHVEQLWQAAQAGGWHFCLLAGPITEHRAQEQLFTRLQVQYNGGRKGLLRYYAPVISDYLFRYCSDADFASWMGDFDRVYWFSTPFWQDEAPGWHTRQTPDHTAACTEQLLPSMQQALERCQLDKLLTRFIHEQQLPPQPLHWWQQQHAHIQHAEAHNIYSETGLLDYLALCRHSTLQAPLQQASQAGLQLNGDEQNKLTSLKHWLMTQEKEFEHEY
ncbi:DUF4123 domain-containing protein [Oceanimonas baumannii]|uniref:DUF4123 domain-containing protein n=1 Tax=Oceanimonas baumannii TaxID=129578 RepID=UPI001D180B3A|nr:DUF4123 domain-containing protein [Oceanimonas baumannii]MCC4265869.1 DUF4123 domain-containing protein [Oceanimonas baumannii]